MKIYCKDCKWFKEVTNNHPNNNTCWHKENYTIVDIWYGPKAEYKKYPQELNKFNNCIWYEILKFKHALIPDFEARNEGC